MKIQGFQKLTLLDFPQKTACTVFTSGCNLRCPFCHNTPLVKDLEAGIDTGEFFEFLKKRKGILDGVCITGGEPLLHSDIGDFIKEIKSIGYAVKLDTNGTFPKRLKELVNDGLLDYVAMDIKSSLDTYERLAGVSVNTENVLMSIEFLKGCNVDHEFRTTAVKNLHEIGDFEKISRLIGDEKYFIQCFKDSGDILSEGCVPFSSEELEEILKTVTVNTPQAVLR